MEPDLRPRKIHPLAMARIERGISQQALAAEANMVFSQISLLERGRRPRVYVDEIWRMAQALGIEEWWTLLAEENLLAPPSKRRKHFPTPEEKKRTAIRNMRRRAGLTPLPEHEEEDEG